MLTLKKKKKTGFTPFLLRDIHPKKCFRDLRQKTKKLSPALKRFEVPEVYSKGGEARLANEQRLIDDLNKHLVKDIHHACVRNTNPRAKPKPLDTKAGLVCKHVLTSCSWVHAIMYGRMRRM